MRTPAGCGASHNRHVIPYQTTKYIKKNKRNVQIRIFLITATSVVSIFVIFNLNCIENKLLISVKLEYILESYLMLCVCEVCSITIS